MITINECGKKKKVFEKKLLKLIKSFEDATSMTVEDIGFVHVFSINGNRITENIFTKIEL